MRAIILAAGEGSRLRPLTNDRPKCMVEYNGRPILDYQLDAMRQLGIKKITIIKGYKEDRVKYPGVDYVVNSRYAETNMVYTLFCAEKFFDDDLIISYGDILYGPSILKPVLDSPEDFAVAVSTSWRELWARRMDNPLEDAETMKIDGHGNILELGKKPRSYEEIQGQYMGLFKICLPLVEKVKKFYHELSPLALYDNRPFEKMFMTSFIQEMINRGTEVKAVRVSAEWLEVDSPKDLEVTCHFS